MDLNKVSLIGNLVKEPVSRKTSSSQSVARFALATNYVWSDYKTRKKREAVEFHNAVAWGKLADIISQYLKKGSKVYIEGRLQNRSWTSKSGDKRFVTEIVVDELIMLGHRAQSDRADQALAKEEPSADELVVEDLS